MTVPPPPSYCSTTERVVKVDGSDEYAVCRCEATIGLGRIVVLYCCSSTLFQLHKHIRSVPLYLNRQYDRTLGDQHGGPQLHLPKREKGRVSRTAGCDAAPGGGLDRGGGARAAGRGRAWSVARARGVLPVRSSQMCELWL
jgi:hypothetical protein